jgi:hypothetical protein
MARADSASRNTSRSELQGSNLPGLAEAPARALLLPRTGAELGAAAQVDRFELISRGDIVRGVLLRAGADGPSGARTGRVDSRLPGLLLVAHDAGESSLDLLSTTRSPCAGWVGEKLALAAIDLPLHGHRASAKLSQRLVTAHAARERGAALDTNGALLLREFDRQGVWDLRRSLDALLALDRFDPTRLGFLGLGLGARIGAAWLRDDPRVAAAVLVTPNGASRSECLTLEPERFVRGGAEEARAFLASRLGF